MYENVVLDLFAFVTARDVFFYKQRQAEISRKSSKTKQHPEAELLLFENYSLSSSTLSFKNNRGYLKSVEKFCASVLMRFYHGKAENGNKIT